LPYPNLAKTAEVLDYRRLGKQRIETLQILHTLTGVSHGWQNHPAVKMWRGSEIVLADYGIAMCVEWIARGYKDTTLPRLQEIRDNLENQTRELPSWWGEPALHISHQSNLIRKDPIYYGQLFSEVPDNLPYYWPLP
jgi:hypothetical protein